MNTPNIIVIDIDAVDDNGDRHPHAGCTFNAKTMECIDPENHLSKLLITPHPVTTKPTPGATNHV